ncbi:MAG TPA: hypothetical protein VN578_13240 [Candidatus Binatia bacterium]|nr:hypothetical protein [Candidatus Binatia bacterium]
MKRTLKMALLAGAGLAFATSVQAQNYVNGDLLVGFTGGSSDFIYDLGQASSLTFGQTWNVGAGRGTQFGVVGAQSTGKFIYATSANGAENGFNPTALYNTASSNVRTISGQPTALTLGTSRTPAPSDTTSWTYQTAQAAGSPGNTFQNNFFNPNVAAGSTAYFFANPNTGGVIPEGFFTYDTVGGMVTYVPEPTVLSLAAGASLLVFSFRCQLARKG